MNGIVATEVPGQAAPKTLLETWGKNERMRHTPPIEWIVQKVDGDLRRRIGLLHGSFAALPSDDSRWTAIEMQFRGFCRAIDRLTETARHGRPASQPPTELGARIDWSINAAVASLNSLDPTLFGRRYPFQTFERSKAEPLNGALLAVIDRLHRLTPAIRAIDPGIDERLLAGLVRLQEPLPEKAIA
jgi:hypothetical protein